MTCQARRSTHIRYTVAVHIPTPWRHDRPPANHEGAVGREAERARVLFPQAHEFGHRPLVVLRRLPVPASPAHAVVRRLEPGRNIVRAHRPRRRAQGEAHAPLTRCKKGSARDTRVHPCGRTQTATDSVADRGAAHVGQWRGANMQKQTMCMGRSPGGALFSGGRHTWRALPTFASTVALAAGTRACTGQTSAAQHTGDTLAPGTRTGFSTHEEVSNIPKQTRQEGPLPNTRPNTTRKESNTKQNTWRTARNFQKHRKQTEHCPRTITGSQHWQRNATCKASVNMSPWRATLWPEHLAHRGNPQAQT